MKIKNLSLGLCLATALIGLSLESCSKKKVGYQVKVSITDENTTRVWKDTTGKGALIKKQATDVLKEAEKLNSSGVIGIFGVGAKLKQQLNELKDKLVGNSNTNSAKLTKVTVSYLDKKGKIQTEYGSVGSDKFDKTYEIPNGRKLTVSATGKSNADYVGWQEILLKMPASGLLDLQGQLSKGKTGLQALLDLAKKLKDTLGKEGGFIDEALKVYAKETKGKDLGARKPIITIQVLKDGVVIEEVSETGHGNKEVSVTNSSITVNEKK